MYTVDVISSDSMFNGTILCLMKNDVVDILALLKSKIVVLSRHKE